MQAITWAHFFRVQLRDRSCLVLDWHADFPIECFQQKEQPTINRKAWCGGQYEVRVLVEVTCLRVQR